MQNRCLGVQVPGGYEEEGNKEEEATGGGEDGLEEFRKNGRQGLTQPRASLKFMNGQNPVRMDLLIL